MIKKQVVKLGIRSKGQIYAKMIKSLIKLLCRYNGGRVTFLQNDADGEKTTSSLKAQTILYHAA